MRTPVVELRGFTYRYPGEPTGALEDLDLTIAEGEVVLLAGGSGSGKSTLLRACCGLVPHYFGGDVWGEARVAGRDLRDCGPAELAGRIGYCAQEAETQVVSATVRAELELPLELAGTDVIDRDRAVEEVALALSIDGLLERTTDSLSGGELQRVALGAALVARPTAVLLDEPTSQLDPIAGDELIGLLRRVSEQSGTSVVICEHRVERCLGLADRVVALDGGRIAFDGTPRDFLGWAAREGSPLATPIAELCAQLGLEEPPVSVRDARSLLAPLRDRAFAADDLAVSREGSARGEPSGDPEARLLLRARGLRVRLEGGVEVIRDLSLSIRAGERVALMGRSGAGKTTALRALAGRIEASAGQIERAADCALLPQWPGDLIVSESVAGEFAAGEEAPELARAGLGHLADRDPRDISGGERQRLAVAIAMAGRDPGRSVLLLDEPTLGMDRRRKTDLCGWLRDWSRTGAGLIVATHDTEFAAELCDRVILLGAGEPVAAGPAAQLLSGGWYFSTEVARAVGIPGVCTVGAALERLGAAGDEVTPSAVDGSPAAGREGRPR